MEITDRSIAYETLKFVGQLNGPAYYKSCPILRVNDKLRFKYRSYATIVSPSEQLLHKRTTSYHALVLQLEGEVHITWDEFKDVVVRPGEMYFLPRGAEYSAYTVGDVSFVVAVIDRGMTAKELDDIRMMSGFQQFTTYEFKPMVMCQPMINLAEAVRDYLVAGVSCTHMHESKFNELYVILHWFYSLADNAQLFYPMAGTVSEFKAFILDNFKINVSIDELVKKSHTSRSTFDRRFKENFNTTPHKWIEEHTRQLILAKASEPNVTVKDIMYEVGISNPSQFTQLCKRICGVTPSHLIRRR